MPIKFIASALIAALLMTGTPTGVSPASGQGAQLTQTTAAETAALTEAEAVAAALAHATLTEEEVTELRARLDRDDGRQHWEVRFRSGDWEYDYDIDRNTVVVQRLIIRLFPDVIFCNVLISLAAVHFIQIVGVKPPGSPKVFFRAADLFAEVLM